MSSPFKYIFIGNNLAIDLVNTQMMVRGKLIDLLQTAGDVAGWADSAGLMIRFKPGVDTLASLIKLRKALKALFEAKLAKRRVPREALTIINRYLSFYPPPQQLSSVAGKLQLNPVNEGLSAEEFFGKIAYEAAQLLVSPQVEQLKKCENENCVLMFLDTSRANRRRWCSMKICGNRAKVASHYINSKV